MGNTLRTGDTNDSLELTIVGETNLIRSVTQPLSPADDSSVYSREQYGSKPNVLRILSLLVTPVSNSGTRRSYPRDDERQVLGLAKNAGV